MVEWSKSKQGKERGSVGRNSPEDSSLLRESGEKRPGPWFELRAVGLGETVAVVHKELTDREKLKNAYLVEDWLALGTGTSKEILRKGREWT